MEPLRAIGPQETPAAAYDSVAEKYDESYRGHREQIEDACIRRRLDQIMRCWTPGGFAVDLGTGTGLFWDWFPLIDGAGVDISPGMIEVAQRKHPHRRLCVADMQWLGMSPAWQNSADLVTCLYGGISYCERTVDAVASVFSILKPGGRCFLMFMAPGHMEKEGYLLGHEDVKAHRWVRSRDELFEYFKPFHDVKIESMFRYPRRWKWLTEFEAKTILKLDPDMAEYHIVTARKPV